MPFDTTRLAKEIRGVIQEPLTIFPVASGAMRYMDTLRSGLDAAGYKHYQVAVIQHGEAKDSDPIRSMVSDPAEVAKNMGSYAKGPRKPALIFDDDIHIGQSILGALCFVADNAELFGVSRIYTAVLADNLGASNFACQRKFGSFTGPRELLRSRAPGIYARYLDRKTLSTIDDGCYGNLSRYYKWMKSGGYQGLSDFTAMRLCRESGEELVSLCSGRKRRAKLDVSPRDEKFEHYLADFLRFNGIQLSSGSSADCLTILVRDQYDLALEDTLKDPAIIAITKDTLKLHHNP